MFREVTAEAEDKEKYGNVIQGKDAFHFRNHVYFNKLPALCDNLLRDYEDDEYKNSFPDLDRIERIDDPSEIEKLGSLLLEKFLKDEMASFHLPEVIDWKELKGFSFTSK